MNNNNSNSSSSSSSSSMSSHNSLSNSSGIKRRLELGLEDLPMPGQIKFPYLPNCMDSMSHSSSSNSTSSATSPQNFPSIQQQLKAFSHHSIESLPSHSDLPMFSLHQHHHRNSDHHSQQHNHHPHHHQSNISTNILKALKTSPITDVLHNLPCNQPEHCDCKQHPHKSLLPLGLSSEIENHSNHDDSHDEDSYDADDEDEHHESGGSGTGFLSPRNITPSTTPLGGSGAHTFGGTNSPTKSTGCSSQCNDANHTHNNNNNPKITKEMDNHIKLLTSLGENPACPNCNIPATRRHDKRRWWCKNCTKSFTPFRKGKKLDANGEFIGNTAPQCGRCFQQATRKHDKRRWWCKVCKKPFTPSQFNLGDNSHIIFVMGANSNKSGDEKSPTTGNSCSNRTDLEEITEETNVTHGNTKKFNSKIELLLNPVNQEKSPQSSATSTPETNEKDELHQMNEIKKLRSKYGDHNLLEEDIMTLNTLQNFRNFFNESGSKSLPITDITKTTTSSPKPTTTTTTPLTTPTPTPTSTQHPNNNSSPVSCTAQQPPMQQRPKYNSLKLTNSYDIIDNDEVVKEGLRNSHHHQQLHHHLNNLNTTLRDHATTSKAGVAFDHRRNVSPTHQTPSNLPTSSQNTGASKTVKTPSEMILDNSFEALVQLNGLEKSQQILYDWLEKSQYTFLFEKILHPEVYKHLMYSKSQN
ncbi:hypothetical protein PPL_09713 [Heterostelium album PN500]|uniref:Uncharacterized protein n=1 Tax=Heterostelium pallidum (strain ATCC 26659 / Pp 5 / PN500) TaxID=670386 RepID=D3BNL0_HETP5|nr:hypothetical protein PPL_09713 [Heterostelium album PN500]EFA76961.1 hypothetical protein PPL_09713 [Heterostelium album PN500]|eukprot:XP_020429092.1 hypothetical protein PPL_09713 [Heterostelium album PN500]